MAIVMKEYLGVREYANGTKQIPVNSNTATFVATKPVRIQKKKQQYKEKNPNDRTPPLITKTMKVTLGAPGTMVSHVLLIATVVKS